MRFRISRLNRSATLATIVNSHFLPYYIALVALMNGSCTALFEDLCVGWKLRPCGPPLACSYSLRNSNVHLHTAMSLSGDVLSLHVSRQSPKGDHISDTDQRGMLRKLSRVPGDYRNSPRLEYQQRRCSDA